MSSRPFRLLLLGCMFAGCSSLQVLNTLTPGGYRRTKNLRYGSGPRQELDIYVPKKGPKPRPVVIFIHGGRWSYGDKKQYKFAGQALVSRGFVAVLPNYRLYPKYKSPAFMQDAAKAVRGA